MLTEFHWHLLGMSMCVVYKQQTIIINCSAQKLGKYAAITSTWPLLWQTENDFTTKLEFSFVLLNDIVILIFSPLD